jgi:uncharacterized protein (DUF2236 family)
VDSVTHKVNREIVVVLGWGRAILLQLAHPLVAAGVAEHSTFGRGPISYVVRARRTIGAMLALTFGPPASTATRAAGINAIHDRVCGTLKHDAGVFAAGTRYSAHDPELLRWVHATLLDSIPLAYECFVGPLTQDERDRYCLESTEMEVHLGMPRGLLPRNRKELDSYLASMVASGQIQVTSTARTLAENLLSPRLGPAAFLFAPARLIAIGLLPPAIREGYAFSWRERDEAALGRWVRAIRRVRAWLPRFLCEWPRARRPVTRTAMP